MDYARVFEALVRNHALTRREALAHIAKIGGAAALAPILHACGDGSGGGGLVTAPPPELRPEDVAKRVDAVVFLMMENRSFDHYFGAWSLPGAANRRPEIDGLTGAESNKLPSGEPVPVFNMPRYCQWDVPHEWDNGRRQLGGGANDGFVTESYAYNKFYLDRGALTDLEGVAREAMGYYTEDQIPYFYALAREFVLCSRWFSALLGPTWPNRNYYHAATAAGQKFNDNALLFPGPGLTARTIYENLNAAGIPWRFYYSDLPQILTFKVFQERRADTFYRLTPMTQFYADCERGTLPPVSFLEPSFAYLDDHPPHHVQWGQTWMAGVLGALMRSPQWERCLFVLTYDEWGGFYDHVVPPGGVPDADGGGFAQLGFRVPSLVIGPYQRRGAIDAVEYDHTSFLAFLEWLWGLPPLTERDDWRLGKGQNLVASFDPARVLAGEPRAAPTNLPIPPFDKTELQTLGKFCFSLPAITLPPPELIAAADRGLIPKELDRRGDIWNLLALTARELDAARARRKA